MSLFLDVRHGSTHVPGQIHGVRFRLWDSQTRRYATEEVTHAEARTFLQSLLRDGGMADGPNVTDALNAWVEEALRRGTNDPSERALRDFSQAWRDTPDETVGEANELRRGLWTRALTKQMADAVFERRRREWTQGLTAVARALLVDRLVLDELFRGSGPAALHVDDGDVESVRALAEEIVRVLDGSVSFDTDRLQRPNKVTFLFRLL